MRYLFLTTALLTTPVFADTIEAVQRVTAVTVYPEGAAVSREVVIDVKAGLHDVVIPYLPQYLEPSTIRVSAEGAEVIGTTFMAERLPVVGERSSPEIDAARAEIKRLEREQRASDAAIAGIREKARVAQAKIAYLNNQALGGIGGPEAYKRASAEIAILIAESGKAEADAREAEVLRADLDLATDKARQALLMLLNEDLLTSTLVIKVNAAADGPVTLTINNLTGSVYWSPIYDFRLTRDGTKGTIAMERGVMVQQETGEDWNGITLTLSTANPGEGDEPYMPYGRGWELLTEEEWDRRYGTDDSEGGMGGLAPPIEEAYAVEQRPGSLSPLRSMVGMTIAYTYPVPVSVRTGTDVVRLAMEGATFPTELTAVAYPTSQETAFLRAKITNTLAEPILPGVATYYVDGALIAQSDLGEMIVQGDEAELFFGRIDGIRVGHLFKSDWSGDTGVVFTASTRTLSESATIRNLTQEAWPIEVLMGLDFTRHADLKIDRTVTPPVSEMDVEGQEGVAKWTFTLEASKEQVISVEQKLSWPDGYVLE